LVLALKPRRGTWAPADQAHTPVEAAAELGWQGSSKPGRWRQVTRRFGDGHTETWWAADATLGGWGPDRRLRLVVATTDPASLPGHSTWYLLTNLPRPASRRAQQANLAEVVRRYGLRNWVEQSYKQVKGELGWADFQVRSDRPSAATGPWSRARSRSAGRPSSPSNPQRPSPRPPRRPRGGAQPTGPPRRTSHPEFVAGGVAGGAGLADPMQRAVALLAVVVASAAAPAAARAA
jgi:hypothetical protein